MKSAITRTLVVAATAVPAILLTACSFGDSNTGSSPSMSGGMSMSGMSSGSTTAQAGVPATGPHNTADVSFATDMIPHHAQALEMAKMALTKAINPQVKQLAQAIQGEQTPEISKMTGWLKGWNKPVPDTSMGGMHMGHGKNMPGMMSSADMAKLAAATGSAFDKLFLTQMITHHDGAVTMANTELGDGQNGDAKTLARSIIAGQSKEITQMKQLLPTIK